MKFSTSPYVVPDNWIDRNKRTVRWPHSISITKTERALKEKINPKDDWMKFPLIKIKITSAKRHECESYNLTSQAEDDEEDQDLATRSERSRAKKGTPEGFVRSGPFIILIHYTTYTFVL
ncbi:hypothetical protein ATANTOWER_027698 [Ataeniobius toweri]|uniref:Uncharacterized protein n=1 Tax=Ataeniobius toweri TaxID=208326 RepID=A0ABU7BII6_9TELE|nr:hypothetical protein [Ataeniobius toweri]